MCLNPITIKNPKVSFYSPSNYIQVPCGKCYECAKKKRFQWCFRMIQEFKKCTKGCYFVTLTYAPEFLPFKNGAKYVDFETGEAYMDLIPCFNKSHVQKMVKKIRNYLGYYCRKNGIKGKEKQQIQQFKFFACSEYGSQTLRPHYHMLLFDIPFNLNDITTFLQRHWKYGYVSVSVMNDKRIQYTTKYILKQDVCRPKGLGYEADRNFILCSKNLGLSFLTDSMVKYLFDLYSQGKTIKVHYYDTEVILPRYYRDKVFTEPYQRVRIAKQLLDEYDRFKDCPDDVNPFEWYDARVNREFQKMMYKLELDIL